MNLEDALHRNAELGIQVQRFQEELKVAQLTIEKLKDEVAYLRRMKYGRSSERLEHAQLELVGGQVAKPLVAPVRMEALVPLLSNREALVHFSLHRRHSLRIAQKRHDAAVLEQKNQ